MSFIDSTDFFLSIAKGEVDGHSIVQISGHNPSVGTKFEDVWEGGLLQRLDYDNQVGNFTPGLVVTGAASGAIGTIVGDIDNGASGTLCIRKVNGTFLNNEQITDTSTGDALVNGTQIVESILDYPTAGETWELVCENTNDTAAGTGARAVQVEFLELATELYTTEIILTNGHTPVTFPSTDAYRMRSMTVVSYGSQTPTAYGKTNLGTIVVRDSSSGKLRGIIPYDDSVTGDETGVNISRDSHYTVPGDVVAYPYFISGNTPKNNDTTIVPVVRLSGLEGFIPAGEETLYQSSSIQDLSKVPSGLPPLTDIKFIARSNNENIDANVQLGLILVEI